MGFERELVTDLTLGVQYYLKGKEGTDLVSGDTLRQELGIRLTWQTWQQTLTWSWFSFYSPDDEDGHLRLRLNYQYDDHWSFEVGSYLFWGTEETTFLGQFQENDHVFTALHYGF